MSPPQATIDALGCHVKGPGSGTAGRETNHVFRNRTTSEMQLQISQTERPRSRATQSGTSHTRPAHAVSPWCAYSRRAVRHVRHAFVLFARRPHRRPWLGTPAPRKAHTLAKGCDGASLLAPTHMEWTWPHSLTHSLKPSHTAHYRHERIGGAGSGQPPQQLRRSWPAARTCHGRALRLSFHPLRAHAQSSSTRPGS